MKNRDRYILKVNEYDMMMNIYDSCKTCPIRTVSGVMHYDRCPKYNNHSNMRENCSECIQKWLNEES